MGLRITLKAPRKASQRNEAYTFNFRELKMKTNSTVILNTFKDKSQYGNFAGFITRKYPDGVVLNSGKSIPFYGENLTELVAKMKHHVRNTYFGAYDIMVKKGSDGYSLDREVSVRSELTFDSNHS